MKLSDLPAILEIEKEAFSQPWTQEMFENEISKNPFSEQILLKCGDVIAGYICFWSLFDEAHILDLAIHPRFRRKGLGEKTVRHVMEKIQQKNIKKIFLEVRRSNRPAVILYQKLGFLNIATRKNYYANPREDALILQWTGS